jgi:hypothetical protein
VDLTHHANTTTQSDSHVVHPRAVIVAVGALLIAIALATAILATSLMTRPAGLGSAVRDAGYDAVEAQRGAVVPFAPSTIDSYDQVEAIRLNR